MDEIQNCIADAQYGEALRGMDSLKPSERIPNPPKDFDYMEYAKEQRLDFKHITREPLGLYFFSEVFPMLKPQCTFLRGVLDFGQLSDPEKRDALSLLSNHGTSLPPQFSETCAKVKKTIASTNFDPPTGSSPDEEPPKTEGADVRLVFQPLEDAIRKDMEPKWNQFKGAPEFEKYVGIKWNEYNNIDIQKFTVFRDLGRGAFGVVSGARLNVTGALVAIKCMNRRLVKGKKALKLVQAEKDILSVLGEKPSEFTVWLRYAFMDKDMYYLCLPLCTGGDLGYHLHQDRFFSLKRAQFHAAEIFLGLQHLHSLGVLYRDLKPENVLLDDEGHCRISDMGLAIRTSGKMIKGRAGTPGYWAPEMIKKQRYTYSADWWSFGCCVYEFLAGRCPFSKQNTKMERDEATLNWTITFPATYGAGDSASPWPGVVSDLVTKLLNRDPKMRLGTKCHAEDIRSHPFFDNIDWEKLRKRELEPPWKPRRDMINAGNQSDIDEKNNEYDYRKLKLLPEDNISNFDYISHYAHQRDLINVLEMDKEGKLEYLNHSADVGCCTVS